MFLIIKWVKGKPCLRARGRGGGGGGGAGGGERERERERERHVLGNKTNHDDDSIF